MPTFVSGAPQPNAFALIIGVEKYRDVPAPTGARADAEHFAALAKRTLGVPENNVRLALDEHASKGDIEGQLQWIARNVSAGGRVYFFFSGHGAPDAANGTPFLLPYDGKPKEVAATALPLASVLDALGKTHAKDVLAIVDTCFSGAGGRSVLPAGARPLVKVKETSAVPHVALFSASSGAEISGPTADGNSGLFTKYLVDALGTAAADNDGDGQVSLQELEAWVQPRVVREAKRDSREQTPSLTIGGTLSAQAFIVAGGLAK